MFTLCSNASCVWAGWCKRFTYKISYPEIVTKEGWPVHRHNCLNGEGYMMNKAREIYERDNPHDSIYDQFKPIQHENNNRESGVREDDDSDTGIEAHTVDWGGSTDPDSVLQLQRSSDRRSDNPSSEVARDLYVREHFEEVIQRISSLLSDTPLDGVFPPRALGRLPYDGLSAQPICPFSENTPIEQ